jgi:hypothetical protein
MKIVYIVYRTTNHLFYSYTIYEKDIIKFEKDHCCCMINKFNKSKDAILSASNLNNWPRLVLK